MRAAVMLPECSPSIATPAVSATVTADPTRAAVLTGRGALTPGLRADPMRVRLADGMPAVRDVRRAGLRVA